MLRPYSSPFFELILAVDAGVLWSSMC